MFKRMVLLVALITTACAVSSGPEGPDAQLIPAGHCGTLTAAGTGPILIGTEPDDLGPAPSPTQYSVTFDFSFYTRNANLAVTDACP
jgi:hypothetical protein